MNTVLLLVASNIFMTVAWYGHLKHADQPLWRMIFISWLIAGVEYCFAVPANRIGYQTGFSAGQLKIMQEVITLLVFAVFAVFWLGETLRWNHAAAFACMAGAVGFMFYDKL
ncbi:MAG TPA: DMT family protein [Azospirillaceae bacterium]|nr:DMT family protein [Azospirillaceae bacterium]HRQ81154.1 DMT family protein [Azospirillaceae bacterium]